MSLGDLEFSEFRAYADCVISWIPESVYNLFYSGKAVGLEDNLDWVTQIPGSSMLASSAIVPTRLDFVEVFDREEIERRLEQINKQVMVENDVNESPRAVEQVPAGLNLWGKIKQFFL